MEDIVRRNLAIFPRSRSRWQKRSRIWESISEVFASASEIRPLTWFSNAIDPGRCGELNGKGFMIWVRAQAR